jgi:hypothetical protein
MHVESLEARTFLSAQPHTVTVPFRDSAEGNLPGNVVQGTASLLGRFTAAFNAQGVVVFTAANGDQLLAQPTALGPTSDPTVLHIEGNFIGGTGRFEGASGTFNHDIQLTSAQGDFVFEAQSELTLVRPWKGQP